MFRIDLAEEARLWHVVGEGQDLLAREVEITAPCSLVLNPRRFGGWLEVEGELDIADDRITISCIRRP